MFKSIFILRTLTPNSRYINKTVVVHVAEEIRDNEHVIDKTIEMTWNGERKLKINQILIGALIMLSSINFLK